MRAGRRGRRHRRSRAPARKPRQKAQNRQKQHIAKVAARCRAPPGLSFGQRLPPTTPDLVPTQNLQSPARSYATLPPGGCRGPPRPEPPNGKVFGMTSGCQCSGGIPTRLFARGSEGKCPYARRYYILHPICCILYPVYQVLPFDALRDRLTGQAWAARRWRACDETHTPVKSARLGVKGGPSVKA